MRFKKKEALPIYWQGYFRDDHHEQAVRIENRFAIGHVDDAFQMCIDEVTFRSMDLLDWFAEGEENTALAQKRFAIAKWGGETYGYQYDLQQFSLAVNIPLAVIAAKSGQNQLAFLQTAYHRSNGAASDEVFERDGQAIAHDHAVCGAFRLRIGEEIIAADVPEENFAASMVQITRKLRGRCFLRCCFGCLYSDYSPIGQEYFGAMLCFYSVAENYLQIKGAGDLDAFWRVYPHGVQVQETHLCPHFRERVRSLGGYRGQIY